MTAESTRRPFFIVGGLVVLAVILAALVILASVPLRISRRQAERFRHGA